MMEWAGVTEEELAERIKIPTDFGETLNWNYLNWVRKNLYKGDKPTEIIYGGKDNITPRETKERKKKTREGSISQRNDTERDNRKIFEILCNNAYSNGKRRALVPYSGADEGA